MILENHYGLLTALKPIGGGWRYLQNTPQGPIRVPHKGSAQSAEALVELVRQLRIELGLEIGDPNHDVSDYIKKVSPINDRFHNDPMHSPNPARPSRPIIQDLREWLDHRLPFKPKLVSVPEADERAKICLTCRQNIKWQAGCAPCNEEINYRVSSLRALPVYHLDKNLKACRLQRAPIQAMIFIDRDEMPPPHPEQPAECWIGKQPT
jgi:hypothetical protein